MHKPVRPKSAKGKTRSTRFSNGVIPATSTARVLRDDSASSSTVDETQVMNTSRRKVTATNPATGAKPKTNGQQRQATTSFPVISRPTSSLSRYKILPGIAMSSSSLVHHHPPPADDFTSGNNDMELLTLQAQQMILASTMLHYRPPSDRGDEPNTAPRLVERRRKTKSVFSKPLPAAEAAHELKVNRRVEVPPEPSAEQPRLLIALKLPDGARVQRYFSPEHTLEEVLAYARSRIEPDDQTRYDIYRMDTAGLKQHVAELERTVREHGIADRTVLFVDEHESAFEY